MRHRGKRQIPYRAVISGVTFLLLAGTVLSVVNTGITVYNTLVKSRVTVEQKLADLDGEYQRRYALVDNLVSIVKEVKAFERLLMEFERSIYVQTAEAKAAATRLSLQQPDATQQRLTREDRLTAALSSFVEKFLVLAQHYPTIPDPPVKERTATLEALRSLQNSLRELEDAILVGRRHVNDAVRVYNQNLAIFPANLVAAGWGFSPLKGFEVITPAAREDVRVAF